ncbi:unnamed protein product [Notodromas monacha]|uniref:Mesoderm induction early response protein 1 n=1 Tax=Notodromas monacha TaxID=399045 RepID=A0A7R9BJN0_9CRUS|nr:unnamed protein product [Notodromas monacha]CAG0915336.1 unnamed protein product [Notodromas monacha]
MFLTRACSRQQSPKFGVRSNENDSQAVSQASDDEEEEEDSEYIPDEKWKKSVNVGDDYQADVPLWIPSRVPTSKEYFPDDSPICGRCLWEPRKMREPDVMEYLKRARVISDDVRREQQGIKRMLEAGKVNPTCIIVKDNEYALRLLKECKYDVKKALSRWKTMAESDEDHDFNLWSEEETRLFEEGYLQHGKDFFKLHNFVVRSRSRAELVEYYYFWKKSLRHDIIASKVPGNLRHEKKKFSLNPCTTEMMDHICDEQEQNKWQSSSGIPSIAAGPPRMMVVHPDSSFLLSSSIDDKRPNGCQGISRDNGS